MVHASRRYEAGYPDAFHELEVAPEVWYWCGPGWPPAAPTVAIVGARSASPYGLEVAETLGFELARRGVTVVSGLARGVDAAAHRGVLAGGGAAVAVVACDPAHPPLVETRELHQELVTRGAVGAEYDATVAPRPGLFLRRNRLVAALAEVVVVVEGGPASGALTTASWARRLGRRVAAVPGDVTRSVAAGPLSLLQSGAAPVAGAADVCRLLARAGAGPVEWSLPPPAAPSQSRRFAPSGAPSAEPLLEALRSGGSLHPDLLSRRLGWELPRVLARLAEYELSGRVDRTAEGRYRLRPREQAE